MRIHRCRVYAQSFSVWACTLWCHSQKHSFLLYENTWGEIAVSGNMLLNCRKRLHCLGLEYTGRQTTWCIEIWVSKEYQYITDIKLLEWCWTHVSKCSLCDVYLRFGPWLIVHQQGCKLACIVPKTRSTQGAYKSMYPTRVLGSLRSDSSLYKQDIRAKNDESSRQPRRLAGGSVRNTPV